MCCCSFGFAKEVSASLPNDVLFLLLAMQETRLVRRELYLVYEQALDYLQRKCGHSPEEAREILIDCGRNSEEHTVRDGVVFYKIYLPSCSMLSLLTIYYVLFDVSDIV